MPGRQRPAKVQEQQWFEADPSELTTSEEKNDRLSDLLLRKWNSLGIVTIRRIEIGAKGWEATYRRIA